jgi:hypothetical protein
MHPAGFEPAILASERPQTNVLDCAATEIGYKLIIIQINYQFPGWDIAKSRHATGSILNIDGLVAFAPLCIEIYQYKFESRLS